MTGQALAETTIGGDNSPQTPLPVFVDDLIVAMGVAKFLPPRIRDGYYLNIVHPRDDHAVYTLELCRRRGSSHFSDVGLFNNTANNLYEVASSRPPKHLRWPLATLLASGSPAIITREQALIVAAEVIYFLKRRC